MAPEIWAENGAQLTQIGTRRTELQPRRLHRRPRRPLRRFSLVFLAFLVAASAGAALLARGLVQHEERGLLNERASEVSLVLGSLVSNVQAKLNVVATVARGSNVSSQGFIDAASTTDQNLVGVALVRPAADGFVTQFAAGPGITVGQTFTGARADVMRRALTVPAMVATPVLLEHGITTVGFALGPPSAPPGTVVYREAFIHPGDPVEDHDIGAVRRAGRIAVRVAPSRPQPAGPHQWPPGSDTRHDRRRGPTVRRGRQPLAAVRRREEALGRTVGGAVTTDHPGHGASGVAGALRRDRGHDPSP